MTKGVIGSDLRNGTRKEVHDECSRSHANHYGRSDVGQAAEYIIRGNENIDPNLTPLNYNLAAEDQQLPQVDFIHKRMSEIRVQKRADVNVLCDWVITQPKELPADRSRDFFESVYAFMRDRYGERNVISAYVHMDETTPHMHFAFMPIVADRRPWWREIVC